MRERKADFCILIEGFALGSLAAHLRHRNQGWQQREFMCINLGDMRHAHEQFMGPFVCPGADQVIEE